MDIRDDIVTLAGHSDLAKGMLRKIDKVAIDTIVAPGKCGDDMPFHPNGRSGCVVTGDDYLFGIRCDHLMWAEGWVEDPLADAIMLFGNHKGTLVIRLIVCKRLSN